MKAASALYALSDGTLPASFEGLKSHINLAWIQEALRQGGTGKLRNRKLSAEDIVWLVIGMALYRDIPMADVAHRLDLVLPDKAGRAQSVSKGAIPQARVRVGVDALRELFHIVAGHWALESAQRYQWRGLMVLGADATTLRVPDSPENRAEFHLPPASRSTAGYPQVRVAVLMVLRSHLWLDFDFADCHSGEGTIAWPLIQRVPGKSVTILDRYYVNHGQLYDLAARGGERHWLLRTRKNLKWRTIKRFGRADELVEVAISREVRRIRPELPETFLARAIRYRRRGFRTRILLTSLLDAVAYPAEELAGLYHERWELELGYDELKTEVLEREETIRSETVAGVRQELWGMGIAYNLIRREIDLAARVMNLPPCRISFAGSLRLIRDLFYLAAITGSPGALPRRIEKMRVNMRQLVLPPRRHGRSYPRHVKIKMSGYARNHGHPVK